MIVLFLLLNLLGNPISTPLYTTPPINGAKLYKSNCRLCHGKKGNRTFSGAKKISKSKLNLEERIAIITNGKGTMAAFGENLSNKEINAIAKYTLKLSNPE